MTQPAETAEALVHSIFDAMPVFRHLGMTIERVEPGRAEIALGVRPELTFDGTAVQAGIAATLLDYAAGAAALSALPAGWRLLTLGMEVHNTAPARGERLLAVGEILKPGKSHAIARADVFAEDAGARTLCATGLVTLRGIAPPTD